MLSIKGVSFGFPLAEDRAFLGIVSPVTIVSYTSEYTGNKLVSAAGRRFQMKYFHDITLEENCLFTF